jgi:hypothetical protein
VEVHEGGRKPPLLHHRHRGRTGDHPRVVTAGDYCCCVDGGA